MDTYRNNVNDKPSGEYKWEQLMKPAPYSPKHGDVCKITLPVEVLVEWVDDIPNETDEITGEILSFTSGLVLKVLPKDRIIYNKEMHLEQLSHLCSALIIR